MEKVEADTNRAIEQFHESMAGRTTIDPDQPFLNGLSLNEFYALPEAEQDAIWTEEEAPYWDKYEEREVTNELPRVIHPLQLK